MKRLHRIPSIAHQCKPDPISERYANEIEKSLRRAEKRWRQAERRAQRVHERQWKQPTDANKREYEAVLAEAERLRVEFEELERLMKSAPVSSVHSGAGQIRHRAGRDDHLEQGKQKRSGRRMKPGKTWRH